MKKETLPILALLLAGGLAGEAFALPADTPGRNHTVVPAAERHAGAPEGRDREKEESGGSEEGIPLGSAKITLQEAIQTALGQAPGAVHEAKLDEEDGSLLYEVSIVREDRSMAEVKVDAQSGRVLKIEKGEMEEEEGEHEG
ncbi:MAG TPA: PepSY domain-containing protein [Candidatus Manganitrophaceae bacterium]|nr:PepSY domain-containing protein [Candidatus Manganitrophaceae bacterium]